MFLFLDFDFLEVPISKRYSVQKTEYRYPITNSEKIYLKLAEKQGTSRIIYSIIKSIKEDLFYNF